MISLSSFKNAFLGVIPSTVLTASKDGIPNVAYLSQVHLLSENQIALTTQFFNKTKINLMENPLCTVRVYDPDTFLAYEIQTKYNHTQTSGPTYEQMAKKLAAIADYSGTPHMFHLQAIEILDVLSVETVQCESLSINELPLTAPARAAVMNFESLQKVCERISEAQNLEELFDSILQAIDLEFGLRHSMILVPQDDSDRLLTISTRGYDQSGVGSEVHLNEGVIGRAAGLKLPFVHASVTRELLYIKSSSSAIEPKSHQDQLFNPIPLPGLKSSQCQIAVPIILRGELLGVLFAESENIFEFRDSDESILKTLSHVIALAMNSLQLSHDFDVAKPSREIKSTSSPHKPTERFVFSFFRKEDCILLNGEYLIRNVPARILWKILNMYKTDKKSEFTNRELRLDPWLQLPEIKDNLETRLILLRKRMEKKCPSISIVSSGRGRFSLVVAGEIVLSEN